MPAVLITGASRGIGRACASRFAREGFDVAVNYLNARSEALSLAEELRSMGASAMAVRADVSSAGEVKGMVEEVRSRFGGLDCLVLNAGIYVRSRFVELREEDWKRTMAVNLDGAYICVRESLPLMEGREHPSIVLVSSQLAFKGSGSGAHYAASKSALLGLMRSLALELAPRIRVNAVAPGMVDTELLSGDTARKRKEREAAIPLGRLGTAQEVASAVWFLARPIPPMSRE